MGNYILKSMDMNGRFKGKTMPKKEHDKLDNEDSKVNSKVYDS